jgi:uncharacterized protein (TIGR02145 family)
VPTDAEWTTLTDYLGGINVAGGKLKEIGTTHWSSPNTGATNETGFTALPGGSRVGYGYFGGIWWSSSELDTNDALYRNEALYRNVDYGSSDSRGLGNKDNGFSVRCVRDL